MPNVEELPADRREMLKLLLSEEGGGFDTFPLSFAQERLWFLDQLEPAGSLYNVPMRLRLEGPLDRAALARALTEIARRHESLRTTFVTLDGRAAQLIGPAREASVASVDLSALPAAERDAEARRLGAAEVRGHFDLSAAPPWRALLARLSATEHLLFLTFHHIIFDGWSRGVLVREASALYAAYAAGLESPLEELPIQYADFAEWQREWLQGEELERQLSYWRGQLAGAPPVLELPADRPRPARPSTRGATVEFELAEGVTRALHTLGRRAGVTPFIRLLAAFKAVLSRHAGQEDIVVGTPVANRRRQELEGLIGLFVNTLVLRTDLSGDPTFAELLGRVRETALGAYAHQDVPFERLVEELRPERSLSHAPVFQVLFALQNAPRETLELPGLRLSPQPSGRDTAKFDLSLTFEEDEGVMRGYLSYSTELFDEATIRRLAAHYTTLLASAVAAPEQRVSALPLLTEAELRELLVEFNDTRRGHAPRCVHELFEAQAARTPDAVAVIHGRERVSYAELDARADRLAHRLRSLGVGAESRVGVLLERTPELVAALLGVMKAGGAYVPLDPEYPRERLEFMLSDSSVSALITQSSLLGRLPACDAPALCVDDGAGDAASATDAVNGRASVAATPENLAYIIYTSGSTGRPKGVAIEHRSACSLLRWAHETFTGEELSGVLASTSVCFDLSVFELFAPLTAGGAVVLARNALELPTLEAASSVTLLNTVPSAMSELVAAGGVPESVRTVNLAGEPLKRALAERVYTGTGAVRVWNLYGPSEDTTYSTCEPVARGGAGEPAIGRPVSNTRAYLLDSRLGLVPRGAVGEIYLGGEGLSRGYLNRPGLTAERFAPDPHSGEAGARLYRTGDLARWTAGGELEYLGRIDHQVKVRGYRIELGEIEAALLAQPGVRACVAVVREDEPGERRVVAYVAAGEAVTAAALREGLRAQLPEYMVPSQFVLLGELPLTPNGKVDRKALPAPGAAGGEPGGHYVAPRNGVEEALCGMWAEVLKVRHVGVEENFFELGGHSLMATRLASRARKAFGVELPLRALFESPTVAGLAAVIERALSDGAGVETAPLLPVARAGALPLSFAQRRLWFLEQLSPGGAAYHIPAALRLTGLLDVAALEESLREVMRRHESLRTTFREVGGEPAQVFVDEPDFTLPLTDLRPLPPDEREAEARRAAAEETRRPFDLARGPLLRAALLRLDETEHVLLLTMHHIVSDGWSLEVLVRETAALYGAFSAGLPSPLAEPPIQYADYAVWQRARLEGGELERQLAYWRGRLAGAPPALELQTDRPRPPAQSFRGRTLPLALPRELTEALKRLGRREGVTLFMTLLAAFKAVLSRHAGQEDVVVGTPIAGRQRLETEGLIGLFVNTLVLRTDLSGDPTFAELLGRVRETTLGAYAHQDVPFERLVEELQPERDLSRTPLFQVMFVLQNAPREALELPGLRLSANASESETAKFDLTLSLRETDSGLEGVLNYSSDIFDEPTAARLTGHFESLLRGAARDPGRKLSALPLLTEAELRELLVEFNDTRRGHAPRCVHELFEAQAALTPDAVAVIHGRERLTYAELDARADRLAHRLRSLGVGAESRVGVLLERTPELVAALLGVMKAGGAYVPLDPEYPQERVRFMLVDSSVSALITQSSLLGRLPACDAPALCVDDDSTCDSDEHEAPSADAGDAAALRSPAATPENLAYIIYTSGSTGRPKGVAIEHRSACSLLRWAHETFTREELSGVLASTSVCFDLSVFELFAPLTAGGAAVLARNALELPTLEAASSVTLVNTVPSAMSELVAAGGVPESVRTVNLAGEPLKRALAERVYTGTGAVRVWNLYGPSEDTTYSTCEPVARGGAGEPAIGRPLHDRRLYVLDARRGPAPRGAAGEIYLGGAGLARGYLNRPALTAERFVPDPHAGEAGARMYRTGDVGRQLAGGRVEYLGRIDHQVKVRGYRIELGEIEAALERHEGVERAVVVVRGEGGDRQLVAYVVPRGGHAPGSTELRPALREKLPEYMVPSQFVLLGELPLTPNGKVDRKALPAPGAAGGEPGGHYVAPRNEVEEALCRMWAEVLRVERVGVEENFFELGGHSLMATRLTSRVKETFGVELPLRALFERPTVAGVALAVIEEQSGQLDAQELERLLAELEQSPD